MQNPTAELFCTLLAEVEDCVKTARSRVVDPGGREALAHLGAELAVRVLHVRKELLLKSVATVAQPLPNPPPLTPKPAPIPPKPKKELS